MNKHMVKYCSSLSCVSVFVCFFLVLFYSLGDKEFHLSVFDATHPIDWSTDRYSSTDSTSFKYAWLAPQTVEIYTFHTGVDKNGKTTN
jgi:hypothetical protein